MKIDLITKPRQNIISITSRQKVENLSKFIGTTFLELAKYIGENKVSIVSAPFVSYKNLNISGTIEGDEVELEVGFPVDRIIKTDETKFKSYILESYNAVTTLYKGNYENLTKVYLKLVNRIKEEKGILTGVCYEYYLSDEEIGQSEQETIIEIPYFTNLK